MAIDVHTFMRFERVPSRRFLCKQCLSFCVEIVPVLRKEMTREYFMELQRRGQIRGRGLFDCRNNKRVECPHGHHLKGGWSFVDVMDPRYRNLAHR